MHEVSIVQNVIGIVCQKVTEYNIEKINKVRLKIGELSGVNEDSIRFAFSAVSKDTIIEGAELIIEKIEATANCISCDISFKIDHFNKLCPKCKIFCENVISGYELLIDSIEGD
jgi:hydrogenase nickel incorporation protein HypA/HybF